MMVAGFLDKAPPYPRGWLGATEIHPLLQQISVASMERQVELAIWKVSKNMYYIHINTINSSRPLQTAYLLKTPRLRRRHWQTYSSSFGIQGSIKLGCFESIILLNGKTLQCRYHIIQFHRWPDLMTVPNWSQVEIKIDDSSTEETRSVSKPMWGGFRRSKTERRHIDMHETQSCRTQENQTHFSTVSSWTSREGADSILQILPHS